jgi:hypothetical protein
LCKRAATATGAGAAAASAAACAGVADESSVVCWHEPGEPTNGGAAMPRGVVCLLCSSGSTAMISVSGSRRKTGKCCRRALHCGVQRRRTRPLCSRLRCSASHPRYRGRQQVRHYRGRGGNAASRQRPGRRRRLARDGDGETLGMGAATMRPSATGRRRGGSRRGDDDGAAFHDGMATARRSSRRFFPLLAGAARCFFRLAGRVVGPHNDAKER